MLREQFEANGYFFKRYIHFFCCVYFLQLSTEFFLPGYCDFNRDLPKMYGKCLLRKKLCMGSQFFLLHQNELCCLYCFCISFLKYLCMHFIFLRSIIDNLQTDVKQKNERERCARQSLPSALPRSPNPSISQLAQLQYRSHGCAGWQSSTRMT